jgi:hypothetical protein
MTAVIRTAEAVARLDSMQPHTDTIKDRLRAKQEAFNVVLLACPESVREAFLAAQTRCGWPITEQG